MAKGKRHTCVECKWYSEEGGPIGSCENTGYRLELEDFCRVPGNPMMIKGPKTWVPTWCHKFWKRNTDSNEENNRRRTIMSDNIKLLATPDDMFKAYRGVKTCITATHLPGYEPTKTITGWVFPKEMHDFLKTMQAAANWYVYAITRPLESTTEDNVKKHLPKTSQSATLTNCVPEFNRWHCALVVNPEYLDRYFVMCSDRVELGILEPMFGMDYDGDSVIILKEEEVSDGKGMNIMNDSFVKRIKRNECVCCGLSGSHFDCTPASERDVIRLYNGLPLCWTCASAIDENYKKRERDSGWRVILSEYCEMLDKILKTDAQMEEHFNDLCDK